MLCSDFSWTDHVNNMAKEAWKALHFTMHILKKGNSNIKSLAYTALVCLILKYGAACWDQFREGQVNVLEWVQKKGDKFANLTKDLNWETLAQR